MARRSAKPSGFHQVAALAYRVEPDGSLRVLLVTTRERGRWIIPKGWPIKGLKNHEAAETEAMEEAGCIGRAERKPIGSFTYTKIFPKKSAKVGVDVYPLQMERQLDDWPEKGQREIGWFTPAEAAARIDDEGAGIIILAFAAAQAAKAVAARKDATDTEPTKDAVPTVAADDAQAAPTDTTVAA